jgi:hypothetical protein
MPRKRSDKEVEELLRGYEARGKVTRRAFCKEHGIGLSTLGYYLRRRVGPSVRLTPVRVAGESAGCAGRFALVLGNGRRIECGPAELEHLISIAEHG